MPCCNEQLPIYVSNLDAAMANAVERPISLFGNLGEGKLILRLS